MQSFSIIMIYGLGLPTGTIAFWGTMSCKFYQLTRHLRPCLTTTFLSNVPTALVKNIFSEQIVGKRFKKLQKPPHPVTWPRPYTILPPFTASFYLSCTTQSTWHEYEYFVNVQKCSSVNVFVYVRCVWINAGSATTIVRCVRINKCLSQRSYCVYNVLLPFSDRPRRPSAARSPYIYSPLRSSTVRLALV